MNAPTRPTLYLNGRFLGQRLTGVQRVAAHLIQALDRELGPGGAAAGLRAVLLHPRGLAAPPLRHIEARALGPAGLGSHAWEQLLLPWAARRGLLLSLAGAAPWFAGAQIAMLHDAAVFDHPEAYTPAFVAWYRALFRRLAARASLLLTPSDFSAARLRHWLGPAPLHTLPGSGEHLLDSPADPRILQRLGLQGRPFFLAVASANPTKNLARLRQAHAAWSGRAEHPLVLVGGSNARVFRGTPQSGPEPDCLQAGPVCDAELKALYQQALALVFPSLYEGFGLPPLEAMHCGCPVIAARAASLPEVCGPAAHYVDPERVEELSAALQRLASEPAYRQRLQALGRAQAARFGWQASASELAGLLRQNAASLLLHVP